MKKEFIDFDSLVIKYLSSLDLKDQTINEYEKILKDFIKYIKVRFILLPEKRDILDYKEYISKTVRSASIQKRIVVIRGFFRFLDSEEIYKDITKGVRGARIEPTFKRRAFSLEELRRLAKLSESKADSLIGLRNHALILLMMTTGLRTIEVERANVADISSIKGNNLLYIQGKGMDDKDNYVKLSDEVYKYLLKYLELRNDEFEPLFLTHARNIKNTRLRTRSIRGIVKEYLRQIDIDDKRYTAHSLRHSVATNLIRHGNLSIEEARQILRHKDIKTTEIYSHAIKRSENDGELIMSDLLLKEGEDN